MTKPFLTARWKNLFMANYEVDPARLAPLIPAGTELDLFQGRALVSLVAFQFLNTRVKGFRIPWHINFPEINLRFYLKRSVDGETRRGVAFISEIVPRRMISLVANTLFNEHYKTRRMAQRVRVSSRSTDGLRAGSGQGPSMAHSDQLKAEYSFVEKGRTQKITAVAGINPQPLKAGSLEDFITEHYYGYTQGRRTMEYQVEHPSWRTFPIQDYTIEVDFGAAYGSAWSNLTGMKPHSVLLAEGSEVNVYAGKKILYKP